MLIAYSSKTKEISIVGNRRELLDLAASIRSEATVAANTEGSIEPYDRRLRSILVKRLPTQKVLFEVTSGGELSIAGDKAKLDILSTCITGYAKAAADHEHMHIEYFPDHFYLSPDSAPAVLSFK